MKDYLLVSALGFLMGGWFFGLLVWDASVSGQQPLLSGGTAEPGRVPTINPSYIPLAEEAAPPAQVFTQTADGRLKPMEEKR